MARSFDMVDWKLAEADFFLGRIPQCGPDFFAVRCYVSAFVSSARSVTFAMQSCLADLGGFGEWYRERQDALRADPLARFFHLFRTVNQHIGDNLVSGGSHQDGVYRYRFLPTEDIPDIPEPDVETACKAHFTKIVRLVYDCYITFGPHIDPKQHYTAEHFASTGRSIEDAEEELFGVRVWTDAPGVPLEHRWQMIRDSQPGSEINYIFEEYLGAALPEPARPPTSQAAGGDGWTLPEKLKKTGDPGEDVRLHIDSLREKRGSSR